MNMLKMISWSEFVSVLLIITILYYVIILIKFYKWEALGIIGIKKITGNVEKEKSDTKPELFKATEKAISALTASIQEVRANGGSKSDILLSAKKVIATYSYLKGTPYGIAVNHFILRETSNSIPLSEEEVKSLWN